MEKSSEAWCLLTPPRVAGLGLYSSSGVGPWRGRRHQTPLRPPPPASLWLEETCYALSWSGVGAKAPLGTALRILGLALPRPACSAGWLHSRKKPPGAGAQGAAGTKTGAHNWHPLKSEPPSAFPSRGASILWQGEFTNQSSSDNL